MYAQLTCFVEFLHYLITGSLGLTFDS